MKTKLSQKIQIALGVIFLAAFMSLVSLPAINSNIANAQVRCVGGGLAPDGDPANCPGTSNKSKCESSDGEWIVQSESVAGKVIDASYCKCPAGLSLIDGNCVGSGSSATSPSAGVNSSGPPATNTQPIETDCEPDPPGTPLSRENCGIINLLVIGINALSAIAGIVIVASLMIAGFQYMTAQDNAGQIQKAKSRIIMTILALALFIFMYAFLNYLVPGGVI